MERLREVIGRHIPRLPIVATMGLVALLAACGQGASLASSSGGAHVTLTLEYLAQGRDEMAPFVKSFEKAYPNITVHVQYTPVDTYNQALYTQLQAGNAPDVFYTNGGTGQNLSVIPLGKAGYLANLADRSWAHKVPSAAHDLYWVGNKLYGLPMGMSIVGVVYNVSLFHQLGFQVPQTFSQLVALCPKIKAEGKIPMALAGQLPDLYGEAPAASTVYASDPSWNQQRQAGKTTFASTKGWQEALDEFTALNAAGCFQPGAAAGTIAQAFNLLASNQAVMFLAPSAAIGAIEGINPQFQAAMFPVPGPSAASTRAVVEYNDSFSVNAHSSHLDAAMKLLDFLSQDDQQQRYAEEQAEVSLPDAAVGKVPATYSAFGPYLKANKVVTLPTLIWPNAAVGTALTKGLQGLMTGQDTVSTVLRNMDSAWDSGSS